MTGVYSAGGKSPLRGDDIRSRFLGARSHWVWSGTTIGFVRPFDGLELVPAHAPSTGLAVIEQGQPAELAFDPPPPAALVGWVRQVWRNGRRFRLDRPPCRWLVGRGPWVWSALDGLFHGAHHAGWLAAQFRWMTQAQEADRQAAQGFSSQTQLDLYRDTVWDGLWQSEERLMNRYLHPGQRLLDIGCGMGREAFGFARRGMTVVGVDVSPQMIDGADRMAALAPEGTQASFRVATIRQLDFPRASFDAAYLASDVYSSTPGRATRTAALAECRRVVRPGGPIIFSAVVGLREPPWVGWLVDWPRRLLRVPVGERVPEVGDRWRGSGPEESAPLLFHHSFRGDNEVRSEVDEAGLRIIDEPAGCGYWIASA